MADICLEISRRYKKPRLSPHVPILGPYPMTWAEGSMFGTVGIPLPMTNWAAMPTGSMATAC